MQERASSNIDVAVSEDMLCCLILKQGKRDIEQQQIYPEAAAEKCQLLRLSLLSLTQ